MKVGLTTSQDFLAMLVRRRWWVIVPFIALLLVAAVLTNFLPKSYISETLILVRPRDVPRDFVRDLIVGTPEERLKTIEQTVLSRTNLIQILREFADDLHELDRLNMDEKVVALRSHIKIDFTLEKDTRSEAPLSYFRISYRNQDPALAQKITSKLTSLFIEQDNQARETQVNGTTEFLASELSKVTDQLNDSEGKLKEVKSSKQYELPDERDTNLKALDRLGVDKKTNAEALDRQLTLRLNLEREISETSQTLPKPSPIVAAAAANPKVEEYRKAEQEYSELSLRYTPKHPDVQTAKARLDRIKEQIPQNLIAAASSDNTKAPADASVAAPVDVPNPLYQKLTAQLEEAKTELGIRQKEKSWIDSEIGKYMRRVENTPRTEQEIAGVQRQTDDLKKQYEDLKTKLEQARLSESLESKQKGSQFQIIDPANYPLDPDKPDKKMVMLGSGAICLLLSVLIALVVDILRQKVWTRAQMETLWSVPVLIDIPEILTDADVAEKRKKTFTYLARSAAGVAVYAVFLYGVYWKHIFLLQQLDPLLQKIIYK